MREEGEIMRRREEEEEEEGLRIDLGRTTILQQVGGQWFGHTAVDLCSRLHRPFQIQA